MIIVTVTEQMVLQAHQGDKGCWFDAWTITRTSDPVRAVLEANASKYRGRPLGKVKQVKMHQYQKWVE